MSRVLFGQLLRSQRSRLVIVVVALALWGFLLPIVYATFGADIERLVRGSTFRTMADLLSRFAGGDIFSLGGSVGALGFSHPIPIALVAVYAVGFPIALVAGERQRGTLEVLLARPIGRRTLVLTVLAATLLLVVACVTAILTGVLIGAAAGGVAGQLAPGSLLACWLNATLLYWALASIALVASVSFDRLGPALGISLGLTIAWYAMEFLGALWPDVAWIRPWSLFHYLQAADALAGNLDPANLAVLLAVLAGAVAAALAIFPRRDLAAPA